MRRERRKTAKNSSRDTMIFNLPSGVHIGRYKMEPGEEVHLDKVNPHDTSGFEGKADDERESPRSSTRS